jgi:CBS domain-containing protein
MILEYARREVITAHADDTAQDVAGLMDYYKVGAVVIVHGAQPVGIVTDRDLALCLLERGAATEGDPRTRKVGDFMTRRLATISEDKGFDEAVELMRQEQVRRLPVVDRQGRLRGIVSLDDLLDDICKDMLSIGRLLRAQARPAPTQAAAPKKETPTSRAG